MNSLFTKPTRSDWAVIGVFWAAALPFIFSDYANVVAQIGWGRYLALTALSIAGPLLLTLILVFSLMPRLMFRQRYVPFILALVAVSFTLTYVYRLTWGYLWDLTPTMNIDQLLNTLISIVQKAGILSTMLAGKQFFDTQQRLILVEKERTEAELRHLKAQIDPHFLFNNLNVLGSLIQRNPEQASAYLHRFSALYRYLIRHKDDDVVPLADEMAFVTDYQYLIGQRFGRAYVFIEKLAVSDSLAVFVPPGSIQTLLENAVKHNQGDERNPLLIELVVNDQTITVRNDLRPKLTPVDSTGTGLANIQARYKLLSDQQVTISQDAVEFVVTLPLLKSLAYKQPA
jgi:two-component system, LytTR family, sensor kinase